ncbi:MAG TPA: glycosyltransferase [Flavisolibacter sp.]|nr:glycosyltransferase [Flavisolibacter sp.]
MNILLATDVIHAGGAETFVLRLAQALQQKGHKVFLYVLYKNKIDQRLIAAIAPDVQVIPARLRLTRFLQLIDSLFRKSNIDVSMVEYFQVHDLKKVLKKNKIEIIHSHLFTTDIIAVSAGADKIPVISTMHGDYSLLWEKLHKSQGIRILNYKAKMLAVLNKLKKVVCISEQQLKFFRQFSDQLSTSLQVKIYNGYAVSPVQKNITRKDLNISENSFVFGMVARGIPEKGWEPAIRAFISLNCSNAYFLLIGDSPYVQELKKQYENFPAIKFIGYSKNPIEYIRLFDAGIFASTYLAESLPTVIMEYLACNLPVISSDIAECSAMLTTENGSAGLIVPVHDNILKEVELCLAMKSMIEDQVLYNGLKAEAAVAFKKFEMDNCTNKYIELYTQVHG